MKILFIHNKYLLSAGGEDTTVAAEVTLLLSRGHDVRTLFFDNASMGEGIAGKIQAGIDAVYNASSAQTVKTEIESFRPDIVHVHNFFFTASPSVILQVHKMGVPVVVTIHNYRLICTNALLLRNGKVCELCVHHTFPWHGVRYKCYHNSAVQSAAVGAMGSIHKISGTWQKKVTRYIVPAAFIRQRLIDSSLKLPPDKVCVKGNFVEETGVGAPDERQDFYLFVGRLSEEKGIYTLLKSFSELQHIKLVVAGDGPEKNKVLEMFGHLPNVEFRGHLPKTEVITLLKTCKALVFPSICYEGLPLSIVEAFATGTPVIASALGAMKEMVQHRVNGLLFEAGNEAQLREQVNIFHSTMNSSCYIAARETYIERYHPSKCYQDVLTIYHAAINEMRQLNNPAHE